MDAKDDPSVWNAWYPIGNPTDIRRRGATRTWLLGRQIDLTVHPTWVEVHSEGRPLPVRERLGYVWTCLGNPDGLPQALIEYYKVDRIVMNIWSTPLNCSGLRIVDNVIDNAHFPFVHPGILGDEQHLDLAKYDNAVDENGVLWSHSHKAWLPIINAVAEYTYRIETPYSVILYIHRPREEGRKQRYDYLGVFAQPLDQDNFIAHKLLAWVREDWMEPRQLRSDQQWISVQDKYVLERHNPKRLPLGGKLEASVPVDSASLAYRDWLKTNNVQYGAMYEGSSK